MVLIAAAFALFKVGGSRSDHGCMRKKTVCLFGKGTKRVSYLVGVRIAAVVVDLSNERSVVRIDRSTPACLYQRYVQKKMYDEGINLLQLEYLFTFGNSFFFRLASKKCRYCIDTKQKAR